MKTALIVDEVYGSHIFFLWGGTSQEMAEDVKKNFDSAYDGATDFVARCWEVPGRDPHTVVILLPEWDEIWSPKSISTLVHELFHAVEYILNFHEVEHGESLSEPWAYYLDSLVRRAMEILPLSSAYNQKTELRPRSFYS
jgi:hypothetical protein